MFHYSTAIDKFLLISKFLINFKFVIYGPNPNSQITICIILKFLIDLALNIHISLFCRFADYPFPLPRHQTYKNPDQLNSAVATAVVTPCLEINWPHWTFSNSTLLFLSLRRWSSVPIDLLTIYNYKTRTQSQN